MYLLYMPSICYYLELENVWENYFKLKIEIVNEYWSTLYSYYIRTGIITFSLFWKWA